MPRRESPICSSEPSTYDLISAYVRTHLKCTQSLADKVVDQLLPVHKEDLEQDAGQMAIGQVVNFIVQKCSKTVEKVTTELKEQIKYITDKYSNPPVVSSVFNEILRAWLIDDDHPMTWERLLVVWAFTLSMVTQSIRRDPCDVGNKIQQLVSLGVNFIDKYASDFLLQQGGWNGLKPNCKNLVKQCEFDIPDAARRIVKLVRFPDYKSPEKKTKSPEQKEKPVCFNHVNFDVISAYVRESLKDKVRAEGSLSFTLPKIMQMLKGVESDYSQTELVKVMLELGKELKNLLKDQYQMLCDRFHMELCSMKDVEESKEHVGMKFNKVMYSWLIGGQQGISWQRIIMLLVFTADIAHAVSKLKEPIVDFQLRRLYDIVQIATEFVNQHFHAWIQSSGGWTKVIELKNC